jgi:2-polyprenyl-3-methyl-5-hydroxy-6-metoxy-1,4-benzoquinol methylase
MNNLRCRACESPLHHSVVDLGMSPLSNSYLRAEQLNQPEPFYPLHARVCSACFLVQVAQVETPENIFGDYAYFSSYSESWLRHARAFAAGVIERFRLDQNSRVVEIASNDGYLLQYFQAKGIPVLGVEPARNVAEVAREKGILTRIQFFGTSAAQRMLSEGEQADLLIANNVLAHVPDLNDFVGGLKLVLKPQGVLSIEVPHLLRMLAGNQFDTIYHEHFSYFSLSTAENLFCRHRLRVFDIEELATHGGSLRLYLCHSENSRGPSTERVAQIKKCELDAGILALGTYSRFADRVRQAKLALLDFLINAKKAGKSIVGYGAPAKGNTLLNYCGVGKDLIEYTVDVSPHKQGRFLPGSRIPIFHPDKIRLTRPDFVLILPWNLRHEVQESLSEIREWGGRFVVPIPTAEVLQ